MVHDTCTLFGGKVPWNAADWTSSDDRVRGGKSHSYLDISSTDGVARFHGNLDIETLGGAGFASQHTTGKDRAWDVDGYDGIKLEVLESDSKRYAFNIKNELLPRDPDTGREQSTISYEYEFVAPSPKIMGETSTIFIPWKGFKATYRGREKPDAPPLKLTDIKQFSIMMRSFFGSQHGDFTLSIKSISAVHKGSDKEQVYTSAKGDFHPGDLEKGMLAEHVRDTGAKAPHSSAVHKAPSLASMLYCTVAIFLAIWILTPVCWHN